MSAVGAGRREKGGMAKGSNSREMASAFAAHLRENESQIPRLEKAAKSLDATPTGKKCKGMEGVMKVQKHLKKRATRTFWTSASLQPEAASNIMEWPDTHLPLASPNNLAILTSFLC